MALPGPSIYLFFRYQGHGFFLPMQKIVILSKGSNYVSVYETRISQVNVRLKIFKDTLLLNKIYLLLSKVAQLYTRIKMAVCFPGEIVRNSKRYT